MQRRALKYRERLLLAPHEEKREEKREEKSDELEAVLRQIQKKVRANRSASANYKVEFFDGTITLFRAMLGAESQRRLDLGWGNCTRQVEIVEVSGTHATMTEAPHAHLLARRFTRCLHRAQREEAQREEAQREEARL